MSYLFVIPFFLDEKVVADYQRQTVKALAKKHKIIVYNTLAEKICFRDIRLFKKNPAVNFRKENNIIYYSRCELIPLVTRFETVKRFNNLLNWWILLILAQINLFNFKIILWGFNPEVADIDKQIPLKHYSLYDCVDYFDSLVKNHRRIILRQENDIFEKFDYVVVNSETLYGIHGKRRKDIQVVPLGFSPPMKNLILIDACFQKPVIGYVGAINYRVDYKLLKILIERNRKWTFVFWGPRQRDAQDNIADIDKKASDLFSLPNVVRGQSEDRDETYSVIRQFDVGMIPYNISYDFNRYCYPMKLFEYFYAGLPVVATPIAELRRFKKLVYLESSALAWERRISSLLKAKWPEKLKNEQKKIALANTWDRKVSAILKIIGIRSNIKPTHDC